MCGAFIHARYSALGYSHWRVHHHGKISYPKSYSEGKSLFSTTTREAVGWDEVSTGFGAGSITPLPWSLSKSLRPVSSAEWAHWPRAQAVEGWSLVSDYLDRWRDLLIVSIGERRYPNSGFLILEPRLFLSLSISFHPSFLSFLRLCIFPPLPSFPLPSSLALSSFLLSLPTSLPRTPFPFFQNYSSATVC